MNHLNGVLGRTGKTQLYVLQAIIAAEVDFYDFQKKHSLFNVIGIISRIFRTIWRN